MKRILFALAIAIFSVSIAEAQLTDKEIKKIEKLAKKEAKVREKEGWSTLPGSQSIERQLFRLNKLSEDVDADGNPKYIFATQSGIGGNYSAAKFSATTRARTVIAEQLGTQIREGIEEKLANDQLDKDEAESLMKAVGNSFTTVEQNLGRNQIIVEMYKKLKNGNTEVSVTISYNLKLAEEAAKKAIRKDLEKESEEVAKKMDKLLGL